VLHVDITRGNEGMNTGKRRVFHSLPARLNVLVQGPGQAADDGGINGIPHGLRNPFHGIEVPWAGNREASLDDVHTQPGQLPRHLRRENGLFRMSDVS